MKVETNIMALTHAVIIYNHFNRLRAQNITL